MSIYSVHLSDYMQSFSKNFHSELTSVYRSFPKNIKDLGNVCFYGPSGVGKYSQCLHTISKYSPSKLKYERKLLIENGKTTIAIKISDIHFEVDFGLLGCNAKSIWHTICSQIKDVLSARGIKKGIVLCKNMHNMHSELVDCFYGYMQSNLEDGPQLCFFLLTEHLSFIPNHILNRCFIIPVKRPTSKKYEVLLEGKKISRSQLNSIQNIKDLSVGETHLNSSFNNICMQVINIITSFQEEPNYILLRDTLYDLLIFDFDIHAFYKFVIEKLIANSYLDAKNTIRVMTELPIILTCFNNNYRPIYHLERFCFFLISTINV